MDGGKRGRVGGREGGRKDTYLERLQKLQHFILREIIPLGNHSGVQPFREVTFGLLEQFADEEDAGSSTVTL